jgi:hypothetical protein
MRLALPLLAVALCACEGTEGTLVVRHPGAAGAGAEPGDVYLPEAGARWLAQLDGAVDTAQMADFFYLDPEQQPPGGLASLHEQGRHYLCYLSAGTVENFRDDAELFPERAVGNVMQGFPNERWLDVRDAEVQRLMALRIQRLAQAGCDGVVPASLTGYAAESGFDLSVADTLRYARFLAEQLHAAGLSAGLTGPAELTAELWSSFDFGLAISCVRGSQCAEFGVFATAKKPVLYLEVGAEGEALELCNSADALGFQAIISDPGFTGRCVVCRDIL